MKITGPFLYVSGDVCRARKSARQTRGQSQLAPATLTELLCRGATAETDRALRPRQHWSPAWQEP
jgi:hypothetical protein